MTRWTQADLDALQQKRAPKPKRSKYHAEPTEVNGITFASKREAACFEQLLIDVSRGDIVGSIELQPRFPLHVVRPDGIKVEVACYLADFRVTRRTGAVLVIDAKGVRTPVYALKKKMVEIEYQIRIIEV